MPTWFKQGSRKKVASKQLTTRRVKDLARAGSIPAHPIGDGARKVWRFLLSELYQYMVGRKNSKTRE